MSVTINGTTGASLVQDATITSAKIVDGTIAPADLSGAQSGSAPIYGCRAWCVFDGTSSGTFSPTAGGNVTSITKNGTGDYTVNFTTAMPDANYAIVSNSLISDLSAGATSGTYVLAQRSVGDNLTTSVRIANKLIRADTSIFSDMTNLSVAIFR